MLTNQDLINAGFKPYDHYTVMNSVYLDIGRDRKISVGCVGTPNEVVVLIHKWGEGLDDTDAVCIHNYDYDGYLTMEKVMNILRIFGK